MLPVAGLPEDMWVHTCCYQECLLFNCAIHIAVLNCYSGFHIFYLLFLQVHIQYFNHNEPLQTTVLQRNANHRSISHEFRKVQPYETSLNYCTYCRGNNYYHCATEEEPPWECPTKLLCTLQLQRP